MLPKMPIVPCPLSLHSNPMGKLGAFILHFWHVKFNSRKVRHDALKDNKIKILYIIKIKVQVI